MEGSLLNWKLTWKKSPSRDKPSKDNLSKDNLLEEVMLERSILAGVEFSSLWAGAVFRKQGLRIAMIFYATSVLKA